uniref:Uncharacterized protein n=1 Tax=Anopheles melas TaxID=34690 RepID=A0A182UAA2_9DIPT
MDILSACSVTLCSPRTSGLATEDARPRSGVLGMLGSTRAACSVPEVDLGLAGSRSIVAEGDADRGGVPSASVAPVLGVAVPLSLLRDTGEAARSSLPCRGDLALEGLSFSDARQLAARGLSGLAEAAVFGSTSTSSCWQCPFLTLGGRGCSSCCGGGGGCNTGRAGQ